jgi:hypothetical protein
MHGVGGRHHGVSDRFIAAMRQCGCIKDGNLEIMINMIGLLAWWKFSGRPQRTASLDKGSGRLRQGPVDIPKDHVLSARSISKL